MWEYIILVGIWIGIIFGWIIPIIRKHNKHLAYEIYVACGVGILFSSMVSVNSDGIWVQSDIPFLRIIGEILQIPAIALVISSIISLKLRGKPKDYWEKSTTMVNRGIFRIVRHPLYLGAAIFGVSFILVAQSIPSTLLGLAIIFCFLIASKKEDEFNIKKFGDSYKEYMGKVPMWNILNGLVRIKYEDAISKTLHEK
jgi:protein-S-isoprenylcysteine O-methyltransferase Ste14